MTASTSKYRPPHERNSWVATLALIVVSAFFFYPFLWMFVSAFKTTPEIYRPLQFWPAKFDPQYYGLLFTGVYFSFWRVFANSLVIALAQAVGVVILTSLAGYVFARHRFRGSKLLFLLAVVVIVIPQQALVVSLMDWLHRLDVFLDGLARTNVLGVSPMAWMHMAWMHKLQLTDHLLGVILPGLVSGLGVIYFTQVFKQIPDELFEAARLAGASEFAVYRTLLPLIVSPLLSFGFIHFVLAWHEHLIPMLVLSSGSNSTLPMALSSLYGSSLRQPQAVLMAASTLTLLPITILFCLVQRRFRNSLSELLVH